MLHGREAERSRLEALLDGARASRSGALVVRGAAGVGKTALLDDARARAADMHVLGARGVETESELAWAGLHQLLRPAVHLLDALPRPQAAALQGALGLAERTGQDRFLISVACLTLLSELAEQRPVLCIVDDAQWLDASSTEALLFVARRLDAEGVVMLFAARDDGPHRFHARAIDDLVLHGLDDEAAAAVIAHGMDGHMALDVEEFLIKRSRGNPLALVELPSALSAAQLAGGAPLPGDVADAPDVERLFRERARRLPDSTRSLMALVATEESGRIAPVVRASAAAGLSMGALVPAEEAGLLSVRDATVELRHPLVRSAILGELSADELRAAHRSLADVLDDETETDQRAWHLAAAATAPDASVADELERAGERARRRSGHVPAAAAFERAAELSVDSASTRRRLVAAAVSAWHAGRPGRASRLLDRAGPVQSDRRLQADADHLRGEIQLRCGDLIEACDILMAAAADIAPVDVRKALEMLVQAREAAGWAGDTPRTVESSRRAGTLPRTDDPVAGFLADVLVGVGALYEGETAIGLPLVRDVVARADAIEKPSWVVWAATGAQAIGDEPRAQELLRRAVGLARASGAVDELTYVLLAYVLMRLLAGRLDAAAEAAEGLTLAREAGLPNAAAAHLAMLAWFAAQQGEDGECGAAAAAATASARTSGGAFANAMAEWGLGVLALSARRADEAVEHLLAVCDPRPGVGHPYFAITSAPDLVEACVLAGRTDRAEAAAAMFGAFAQAGAPTWASALAARCRALLADDPTVAYTEALRLHAGSDRALDRARTSLLFGEHLRRAGRSIEARDRLRSALEAFERLGAADWARRARDELRAAGEAAEERVPNGLSRLTRQELQVARLAAEGHSNREVAARLFLSPRTVDAQLQSVFAKAGIASRIELAPLGLAPGVPAVLRARLARVGLAELVRDLRTLRGGALQEALARTLGDPALVVAYRRTEVDAYADADGNPVALPAAGGERAVAPVEVDGRALGALLYDPALDDDPELVDAVASAVAIAMENERLHVESQARLDELRASRERIVSAGDAERRRLERNLHDGAQQRLVALAIQLRLLQADIRRDPSRAEQLASTAGDQLALSLEELRELARGIHPAVLQYGLPSALASLATRATIPTAVSCEVEDRLPESIELALYFVACEALANVGKYAAASSASLRLWRTERGVAVEIADDGVGGADPAGGSGLRGLADRVEALDGLLLVTSPPGAGTVVTAELPYAA